MRGLKPRYAIMRRGLAEPCEDHALRPHPGRSHPDKAATIKKWSCPTCCIFVTIEIPDEWLVHGLPVPEPPTNHKRLMEVEAEDPLQHEECL